MLLCRHTILLWEWLEALTKGVVSICYNHEGTWIELLNLMLYVTHLLTAYNKEDHLLLIVCVHTLSLKVGTTTIQILKNVVTHILRVLLADDIEQLIT